MSEMGEKKQHRLPMDFPFYTQQMTQKNWQEEPKQMFTNKDDSLVKQPKKRSEEKVGRNDPCPCGSGKKYKQCCGRNA